MTQSLGELKMNAAPIRVENEDRTAWIEVVPERGGIVTAWHALGQDLLYLDRDRFADPSLSIRGGIPILFPLCGNLPHNTYTVNDQTFQLKQHGFARDLPWQVFSHSESALTLGLNANAQTLAQYPFNFAFQIAYRLQGNTLNVRSQIANQSTQDMPFSLGFHPYFAVADKSALTFDLPATQQLDHQTLESHPYTGSLDLAVPELDVALFPVTAQKAGMGDRQQGIRLDLAYDACFTTLVVWTVDGKPYVCLEPWTAQRNALNTGHDLLQLQPGQSWQAEVRFTVERLTA
ncbi:MAG: aldose epimerase [Thermosynechococcaceae cyanobacterium]